MDYRFDGRISKEVLGNYLSRAVTAAGLFESGTLTDDLRVIGELGVKFLGRASGRNSRNPLDFIPFFTAI